MDERHAYQMKFFPHVIVAIAILIGIIFFGVLQIIAIKAELQDLRNQTRNSTIQYQAPAPSNQIYVGSADSLLHEFTYKADTVSADKVVYKLNAKVKEYTQGDRLYFMSTMDDTTSFVEAVSENGVNFTAVIEVPIDKEWSADFVSDRNGTRKSEVLQSFQSYNEIATERWSFPSLEGSSQDVSNSNVYRTARKVSMNFDGETKESVGIAAAVAEVRLNGTVFKEMSMTPKIYSGNTDEFPQQQIEANLGNMEIPCKKGDVIETVARLQADTGIWYTCTLERLKYNGNSAEYEDTGTYEWKAEK